TPATTPSAPAHQPDETSRLEHLGRRRAGTECTARHAEAMTAVLYVPCGRMRESYLTHGVPDRLRMDVIVDESSAGRGDAAREPRQGRKGQSVRDSEARAARSRASASLATARTWSLSLSWTMTFGSIASTMLRPSSAPARTITLHGSNAPSCGSAARARRARLGLHAPRMM